MYIVLGVVAWLVCAAAGYVLVRRYQRADWYWCVADRTLWLGAAVVLPPVILAIGIVQNIDWNAPAKW